MTPKKRLIIAAAVLALVVSGGYFGARYFADEHQITVNDISPEPYKELITKDSQEWIEEHFPGPDGKDVATRIYYKDTGETGWREFSPTHVRSKETVWFSDGTVRAQAEFSADGHQIINGFELRADRTKAWSATSSDGLVTTTTMWADGNTVFSIEKRKIGAANIDVEFHTRDGKMLMHYAGKQFTTQAEMMSLITEAQVWNADGKKLVDIASESETVLKVRVYRADGTLSHVQQWETFPWYRMPDGSVMRRIAKVTKYGPDGVRVVREIELYSGTIHKLTDYEADGSRIEYTVSPWGGLSIVEKFNKEGHKTGNIDPKNVRIRMEDDATQPVSIVNPKDEWSKGQKPGVIKENLDPPPPPPQQQPQEWFD